MKIVAISDTHGFHDEVDMPKIADTVVHAGDFSMMGTEGQIENFFKWFSNLPYKNKICIAGNHDFLPQTDPEAFKKLIPDNVTYLENSGIEIDGVKFWGSPWTPEFFDWAFMYPRGSDFSAKLWSSIPGDTDVLITHGPPLDVLDTVKMRGSLNFGQNVGCYDLKHFVSKKNIQAHCFGHIHENGYKKVQKGSTTFYNCSVLNQTYDYEFLPHEFQINKRS